MSASCLPSFRIDSLLITKNGFALAEFYKNTFGLSFSFLCEKKFELYICNDQNISIYTGPLEGYVGGLLQYEQGLGDSELCMSLCKDDCFVKATLRLVDYNSMIKNRNLVMENNWYSIFRANDLCKVKNFFSTLGEWTKEQHIRGPKHYHLNNDVGGIYEIYPMSKFGIEKMQFFIPRKNEINFENFIYDSDGRGIKTIKK